MTARTHLPAISGTIALGPVADTGRVVTIGGKTVTLTPADSMLVAHGFTKALNGTTAHRTGTVGSVDAALRVIFAAKAARLAHRMRAAN